MSAAGAKRKTVEFRAQVVAVQPPNEFDVPGYHVVMDNGTSLSSYYRSRRDDDELRNAITIGTVVDVRGSADVAGHTVAAEHVTVHDEQDLDNQKVSGFGVIDKMLATGAEPAFRADGYVLRVNSRTHVDFLGEIDALDQVNTNVWVRYVGLRNDKDEVVLTWAEFDKPKKKAPKHEPNLSFAQVTTFPSGSIIDFDGSFRTDGNDRNKHKDVDQGGACGWYPVSRDAALQAWVRRVGFRVIPQYQRDLPADDPSKIPFRFYVVEEDNIHDYLGCGNKGLILVAAGAVKRLENDDQLAALLADRIATNLQRVLGQQLVDWGVISAAEGAAWTAGPISGSAAWVGQNVLLHEWQIRLSQQRGRMALGYMADAGFDPWQSPETWRLLAPSKLPRNLSRLKYPSLSRYELGILELEYKRPAGTAHVSGNN